MSASTIQLFVQIDNKTVQISAQENWSILQLKQHLYLHSNTPSDELRVIFAGSELSNSVLLKNCQFAGGTTIHAVVVKPKKNIFTSVVPTNFIGPTHHGIVTNHEEIAKRSRFYVFCKNGCDSVQIGKLRVRCKKCKDEAFEISKGPDSWKDILTDNQITGLCNSQTHCDGTIAEFYFKCGNHERNSSSNEHENVVALPLLRTNIQSIPCLACTDISNIVLVFPCEEKHVICLECFASYCETKLNSRRFTLKETTGYTLPCPGLDESCAKCYIDEVHHFMIAGKIQYERYKKFAAEDFVLQNGGILCPGKGCGNGILLDHEHRKVVCYKSTGGCGLVFCRLCLLPYHDGECTNLPQDTITSNCTGYEINYTNALQAKWRDEIKCRDTIALTTKPCPQCHTRTEKSGGCNHMHCARCNFQWCWLCLVEWGRSCEADHWFRAG